jgi:hypothetical protein
VFIVLILSHIVSNSVCVLRCLPCRPTRDIVVELLEWSRYFV